MGMAFSVRMLISASAIASLVYFKKVILDFTLPNSLFMNTLPKLLYVRQNDTMKTRVWTKVEGAEAPSTVTL